MTLALPALSEPAAALHVQNPRESEKPKRANPSHADARRVAPNAM